MTEDHLLTCDKLFVISSIEEKYWRVRGLMASLPVAQHQRTATYRWPRSGVFNLLSSRANLYLSYNPAGRSHCRLQNHHGYIKHHHRGMGGSSGDVGEVPMTQVKQRKDCRMSCDVGGASFSNPYIASPTSRFILQPFRRFTHITARSTTLPLLHLRHRHFNYVTAHSPTLPPLHLRHSSSSNPSVASPTSQALHVLHLASRPCIEGYHWPS